jgi:hypothetical protein
VRRCAVACVAALLAGCGAGHGSKRTTPLAAKLATAQRTHEYPSPKPPAESVAGDASASALEAVRGFANAYINWSAATVAGDMRTLAGESVGQARSALQLAAAQTASDYELQQGGISNSGTVEAISPLPGGGGRYVVVTRESTTATDTTAYDGLLPAWHVTIATVSRVASGAWVVSGWQPES